ncbi:hypothetical protein F442_01575, partial [Phytophthora nicotianae P10297]
QTFKALLFKTLMVSLLLAVDLLFRSKPELTSLAHVATTVSVFLDSSVELPLNEACKLESVELLQRIWDSCEICTNDGNISDGRWTLRRYLRSDPHYRQFIFSDSLNEAMYRGNLEIGKWLLDHFKECRVEVDRALGDVPGENMMKILQFLHENNTNRPRRRRIHYFNFNEPNNEPSERPNPRMKWGGFTMVYAAQSRRHDAVWWLNHHYPDVWYNLEVATEAALRHGDIHLAEQFIENGSNWPTEGNVADEAAEKGNLPVLQWLLKQVEFEEVVGLVVKAAGNGHLQVVRWLIDHSGGQRIDEVRFAIHTTAIHGHLHVAKFLREKEKKSTSRPRSSAVQPRVAAWEHGTWREAAVVSAQTMIGAARNGHLDVVKWLYSEYGVDLFDSKTKIKNGVLVTAMDAAAGNGHLDVLKYFHGLDITTSLNGNARKRKRPSNQTGPPCSQKAMDKAAANGSLNVVQWLHQNRQEGCSTDAMDAAATGGHLEMVKWLHNERSEGCTSAAMDGAATNGHLEVVKWLHNNVNVGCTTEAMDGAAANGHLGIAKWLHSNRSEGCTTKVMDSAAARGSLGIVKWLHRNRDEGCTK